MYGQMDRDEFEILDQNDFLRGNSDHSVIYDKSIK